MKELNILSFGAGTQSTALLLLYLNGKLDVKFDYIIFAHVGYDKEKVINHFDQCILYAMKKNIIIDFANYRNLQIDLENYLDGKTNRVSQIPFFTKDKQGNKGIMRRQCTYDYKIAQVLQKIRELENVKTLHGYHLNMYLGISVDEFHRAKASQKKSWTFKYPLLDEGFDRLDCINYVKKYLGYNPPSSECYMCPFQDNTKWLDLKLNYPKEWKKAIELDRKIRNYPKINSKCYLHKSCVPLEEADLQENQISLFDNMCGGGCGL